ncbi:phosphoribosylanthranilate isomerase [Lentilactobacillus parakefiri]|uniref:N-(5'-phosphoribosyl)anthranilate isomerase n=1 Tax=Lentilactobacillus parakefiri TaxID=152332 RepID=A0A224VIL3_9LACO|nr:phosphoribosylanthranilate isomerase [Lentilactobacillus parakefiri]KRL72594.1 phosphoribosylanthranilate isomerase [Lentilactobacillus parakefiri DSM 10551]PAL00790.1 N-(5'-phosphoribosyl)anthranilate isomerase [Lentilactobacillus parakefiri]TDG94713.1 hypothetical protein C5L28_000998 [Lentilactobacillus parakefiri]GAW72321.1 phosphoribosylanthranilate isomerase [Lentilactobacillus parakefiri]
MVKVKICGLMKPEDITAVNEAHTDFAGFVFAKSRHVISLATALALQTHLNPSIQKVGVFVDESVAEILAVYRAGAIDIAQLHGRSTPEEVAKLQHAGLKVIQVFEHQSIDPKSTADYLMVDSGKGSGQTLNWQAISHINRPIILAGGLTPNNVSQAIQVVHPDIVDVSSGVEANGQKDPAKIQDFIKNTKEEYVL